jgi:hypothetical protein
VPKSVLTRKRSLIARFAILAMVFSLMAVALPASAHSVALSSTGPCPAATPSAGFTDISGYDATTQTAINCLFAFGITTGTSATTYSPEGVVPRWQMALFLVRQAADHGLTIPAATSQGYTDIGGFDTATQNAINQVTQLGISKGTSTTTFSPNLGVSRWQMALFIYRTGLAAGVTFNNTVGHNDFTDIGGQLAEAQTAINALADTRADPEGHIALGTGGSLFSPDLPVLRWQMALFLTRLLAADNIAAPANLRVSVTPTDTATQAAGTGRVYTATFKNADGTAYTGPVGVMLRIVSSAGVIDWDGAATAGTTCPDNTTFEAPTDGLVAGPGGPTCGPSLMGFPGADGVVSFTVRHDGTANAERVVPVAWEDLDGDGLAEIVGNNAPTEFFGAGGQVAFTAAAAVEAADGAFGPSAVTVKDAAGDRFETAAGFSYFYDSSDLFRIEGSPTDLAGFEAALNVGDTVTGVYDDTVANQSTFDISTDTDPALTITTPAAATTVDANSFAISGTAVAGYTVAIYVDNVVNNGLRDAGEPKVGETTAAADGTWTVNVALTQNAVNDFVATQRSAPAASDLGDGIQVPLITEGANTAALITAAGGTNGGVAGVLDVGDTVFVDFNEDMTAPGVGDSIDLLETVGGTSVRLTVGTNATATLTDSNTITFTVTGAPTVLGAGDNGVLNGTGVIQALGGFVGTDGQAPNVAGSVAGNKSVAGF